jgi:hypothetical protein
MHKYFITNFTFIRRKNFMGLIFELNFIRFFYTKTAVKKCSSKSGKWSLVIDSITLLMELFVNCSKSNDRASIGKTTSGSMKVT